MGCFGSKKATNKINDLKNKEGKGQQEGHKPQPYYNGQIHGGPHPYRETKQELEPSVPETKEFMGLNAVLKPCSDNDSKKGNYFISENDKKSTARSSAEPVEKPASPHDQYPKPVPNTTRSSAQPVEKPGSQHIDQYSKPFTTTSTTRGSLEPVEKPDSTHDQQLKPVKRTTPEAVDNDDKEIRKQYKDSSNLLEEKEKLTKKDPKGTRFNETQGNPQSPQRYGRINHAR